MSQINVTTIRNRTGGPPSLDQGVVVGSAATFSSTVSIAGTLTYEDVTNIDSVGIITAQSYVSIADSIVHTGDINTSLRFPANDTFAVETAGSEALRIDSSGNMGIGGAITDNYGTNHRVVQIHSGSSTNSYLSLTNSTTGDQGASHGLNLIQTGVNALVNNRSAGYLAFQTSDVERMRIDSSGASTFFGEITASNASLSSFKLDYNSSQFDAYLQLRGNDLEIRGSSGQMEFYIGSADGASSTEKMRLTNGGQLLINTTSNGSDAEPALIVSGRANDATDSGMIRIKRGEAAASMSAGDSVGDITFSAVDGGQCAQVFAKAATGWSGTSDSPGELIFKTTSDGSGTPTERMRIDNNGAAIFSGNITPAGLYLGGTGAANHLDDYEEGSWTPALSSDWTSVTYTIQRGRYIKIGNLVYIYYTLQMSAATSPGGAYAFSILNLPFQGYDYLAGYFGGGVSGSNIDSFVTDNWTTVFYGGAGTSFTFNDQGGNTSLRCGSNITSTAHGYISGWLVYSADTFI